MADGNDSDRGDSLGAWIMLAVLLAAGAFAGLWQFSRDPQDVELDG